MLEVTDITVSFDGLIALNSISFKVGVGEFCGVIGPNGAGKTTLFNAISRLVPLQSGDIKIGERSIVSTKPNDVVRLGIARTFQQVGIFPSLTVEDNIAVGALSQNHIPLIPEILGMKVAVEPRAKLAQRSREIAELCGLGGQNNKIAGILPLGLQKRIELARALAADPAILLLDEPAGGLSHREIDEFLDLLVNIKKLFGLTIIMIEHHLGLVMRASDHIIVLNFGLKIAEGTATEVRNHPEVVSAYIGAGA